MKLQVKVAENSLSLDALIHAETGHDFLGGGQDKPFWKLELRDASRSEETKRIIASTDARAVSKEGNSIHWIGLDVGDEVDVLAVTVTLDQDLPLPEWRIEVQNNSIKYGLWQVHFPILCLSPSVEAELVLPRGWGGLERDPAREGTYHGVYPQAFCTMQFVALLEGDCGLYLAAHDPSGTHKEIRTDALPEEERVQYELIHFPMDMGKPGLDLELPYPVVVGSFRGNWVDAAKIYRTWVRTEGEWFRPTPLVENNDVPTWLKEVVIWCQTGGPPEQVVPAIQEFVKFFGVPTGIHWYNWHQIPFDDHYPEYFPPKEGFQEGVSEIKAAGVRVMPYINGRLFDSASDSWTRENAEKYCALGTNGEKQVEVYGSSPPLSPMCPATPYWQDKVAGIVERLVGEFGVDGVYIDQIASAPPVPCFNQEHGHPLGGGNFWVQGYREMLPELRSRMRAQNPDAMITTEDAAEPYTDLIDAFLMCNQTLENTIPIYPAVYGGRNLTFGRSIGSSEAEGKGEVFFVKVAQMFLFGAQLGWIGSWVLRYPACAEYLRRLAQLRARALKYLAFGELIHSPRLTPGLPIISTDWPSLGRTQCVDLPVVSATAWQAPDKSLGIVFTNISEQDHIVTWTLDARYRSGEVTSYQTRLLSPEGPGEWEIISDLCGETIIPPRSGLVVEIRPVK